MQQSSVSIVSLPNELIYMIADFSANEFAKCGDCKCTYVSAHVCTELYGVFSGETRPPYKIIYAAFVLMGANIIDWVESTFGRRLVTSMQRQMYSMVSVCGGSTKEMQCGTPPPTQ